MNATPYLLLLSFVLGAWIPVRGQLAQTYVQDFEEQIPGDVPAGWRQAWGEQGDDQFMVTNLRAASGTRAMLLDRETGTNTAQWGFQKSLPVITSGWLHLSFAFCMEGKGGTAHLGFELRNGNGQRRALSGSFGYNRLSVHGHIEDVEKQLRGVQLGRYVPGRWYRVSLWLPSAEEGIVAYAVLAERLPDGSYLKLREPQPLACDLAHGTGSLMMLNLPPNLRGFRFFLDDLAWECVPARLP